MDSFIVDINTHIPVIATIAALCFYCCANLYLCHSASSLFTSIAQDTFKTRVLYYSTAATLLRSCAAPHLLYHSTSGSIYFSIVLLYYSTGPLRYSTTPLLSLSQCLLHCCSTATSQYEGSATLPLYVWIARAARSQCTCQIETHPHTHTYTTYCSDNANIK